VQRGYLSGDNRKWLLSWYVDAIAGWMARDGALEAARHSVAPG
jgi:hypothetical protein